MAGSMKEAFRRAQANRTEKRFDELAKKHLSHLPPGSVKMIAGDRDQAITQALNEAFAMARRRKVN